MPSGRKIREPSMPPSMQRVKGEKLRTGWTTGSCAAAAAKAAAKALVGGEAQEEVDIKLPRKGEERRVRFAVERCEVGDGWAEAVVVKDAGDDPDVTHGAHLTARVSWREEPGIELDRGEGVGLGTTGIVRPFSTASWRASVGQAINVMGAQDNDTLVLSTGGLTEKAAMRLLPNLEEVCFVEVGDFTGYALKQAVRNGLARVFFVGMVGKITKLAAGVMMTHW